MSRILEYELKLFLEYKFGINILIIDENTIRIIIKKNSQYHCITESFIREWRVKHPKSILKEYTSDDRTSHNIEFPEIESFIEFLDEETKFNYCSELRYGTYSFITSKQEDFLNMWSKILNWKTPTIKSIKDLRS
jgi:hypothetical protein